MSQKTCDTRGVARTSKVNKTGLFSPGGSQESGLSRKITGLKGLANPAVFLKYSPLRKEDLNKS